MRMGKAVSMCVCVLMVLTCAVLVVLMLRPTSASGESPYPENADGLTYGSLYDAEINGNEPPDLVRARATNGVEGYFRYEEYAAIVNRDYALAPDEVAELEFDKYTRIADEFKQLASGYFGSDLLSRDDLRDYFMAASSEDGMSRALAQVNADAGYAVQCNRMANGLPIVEGGTGEDALGYTESAVAKSEAQMLRQDASALPVRPSKLTDPMPNGVSDNYVQMLEEEVAARGRTSLMSETAFYALYNEAASVVKVPLAVYEADGVTPVGEVLVDVL